MTLRGSVVLIDWLHQAWLINRNAGARGVDALRRAWRGISTDISQMHE